MKSGLSGRLAVDASVLIDLVFSSPMGLKFKKLLKSGAVEASVTELCIAELRYAICRKHGLAASKERVDDLLASGYVHVEDSAALVEDAAMLKCERALSLADCFCLALAQKLKCNAIFAKCEAELAKEMRKKPFDTGMLFLEDFR